MKILYSTFLLILLSQGISLGQQNYFVTPEKRTSGIVLIKGSDKENAQVCKYIVQVNYKKEETIDVFKPDDLIEYGFDDGRVYVSREIEVDGKIKKVFLLRLYDGNTDLYYYPGKFSAIYFIDKGDSVLIPVRRSDADNQNLKQQLKKLTDDCESSSSSVSFVHFNKRSITNLIERYDNCSGEYLPHARIGIVGGYEYSGLFVNSSTRSYSAFISSVLQNAMPLNDGGFSLGLTADIPVINNSFSLNTRLCLARHANDFQAYYYTSDYFMNLIYTSLRMPVMFRYNYSWGDFVTYGDAGITLQRNFFSANYLSENNERDLTTEIMAENLTGFSVGAGCEYHISNNLSIFMDLRYERNMNSGEQYYLNVANINLSVGVLH